MSTYTELVALLDHEAERIDLERDLDATLDALDEPGNDGFACALSRPVDVEIFRSNATVNSFLSEDWMSPEAVQRRKELRESLAHHQPSLFTSGKDTLR